MTDLFGNDENASIKPPSAHEGELVSQATARELNYDFSEAKLRKAFHNGEWWFAYLDIIAILSGSCKPRRYASELKKKLQSEGSEVFDHIEQLKIKASDGKLYSTQCLNRADTFRLIEDIPSPKAEPLKQWISRLAHERLEEIENPARGVENSIRRWKQMGKSDPWIEARVKGISIRNTETDTLKAHGISSPKDFAHFTDLTNKAVYGRKAKSEKRSRELGVRDSLRDNSTQSELLLLALHEDACSRGIEKAEAWGRPQIDGVYDKVGSIISGTREALLAITA